MSANKRPADGLAADRKRLRDIAEQEITEAILGDVSDNELAADLVKNAIRAFTDKGDALEFVGCRCDEDGLKVTFTASTESGDIVLKTTDAERTFSQNASTAFVITIGGKNCTHIAEELDIVEEFYVDFGLNLWRIWARATGADVAESRTNKGQSKMNINKTPADKLAADRKRIRNIVEAAELQALKLPDATLASIEEALFSINREEIVGWAKAAFDLLCHVKWLQSQQAAK